MNVQTEKNNIPAQKAMRYAVLSACWGAISQVMVKDSSVIIIFAGMIGAGEMVSLLSTSLQDLMVCLTMLMFAALSRRIGIKKQIIIATTIAAVALFGVAASPAISSGTEPLMIVCLCLFSLGIAAYLSAWFPLLENIVPSDQRGLFFGRMRVTWQIVAFGFIFSSAWFVGKYATVPRMQIIIAAAAAALLVRIWCVYRIPFKEKREPSVPLLESIRAAVSNKPLMGFGVYLLFLYTAANGTVPVCFLFARNFLKLPDNFIVALSALAMTGLIAGFFLGGKMVHRYGTKGVFLCAHIGFAVLNILLLSIRSAHSSSPVFLAIIIILYSCGIASASIAVSSQLLSLALPENKAVSIALGYTLYSAGLALSRVFASVTLGSGILSDRWSFAGINFTRYHSLFLIYAVGVLLAISLLVMIPGMVRQVERLPAH